jgi:EF-hand domain pair
LPFENIAVTYGDLRVFRPVFQVAKKLSSYWNFVLNVFITLFSYTEHSTVGLAQQWDQLNQLGMRIKHNLEQQIQARNQSGVSEDALKEFSMMFRHFDKDKTGRLNHNEFKSCLRALGYDLPMLEEGEPEPEFEAILDVVDPNRDGFVSLQVNIPSI